MTSVIVPLPKSGETASGVAVRARDVAPVAQKIFPVCSPSGPWDGRLETKESPR